MICRRSAIGDGAEKGECCETAPQDSRAKLAGRARYGGFEVRSSRFSEPRTSNYGLRISRLSRDSRFTPLADFFSILLVVEVIQWKEGL